MFVFFSYVFFFLTAPLVFPSSFSFFLFFFKNFFFFFVLEIVRLLFVIDMIERYILFPEKKTQVSYLTFFFFIFFFIQSTVS